MNTQTIVSEVKSGAENVAAIQKIGRKVFEMTKTQRVLQCFFNADLRNGHEGLQQIATEAGLDVGKLSPGQYVIFVNAKRDRLKLYAANHVVAYYKAPAGQSINLLTIQEIPRAFMSTGRIDYDVALKAAIEKTMERRARRKGELNAEE